MWRVAEGNGGTLGLLTAHLGPRLELEGVYVPV